MIQKIPLVCLGAGTVGRELISQILLYGQTITQRTGFSLVPIVIADSTGALVDPKGLALETLQSVLDERSIENGLSSLSNFSTHPSLAEISQQGLIVIDLTASSNTEPLLRETLENGFGVVLANKIPLTGPWQKARKFFNNSRVRYECTAGAGLPLIETLNYLLDSGDQITSIEGCFSGTLGYLCTELENNVSYSEAVLTACKMGYAEPDPRIDLSGKDVARKALILARTAGWSLMDEDLHTHPLYPENLAKIPLDSFLSEMHSLDDGYRSRFESALANKETIRYVARITADEGEVGLRSVDRASSLGTLSGPANYISLQTRRYFENPIIISGPGAGPAVTAAGVLGDVIKLAQRHQRG